jgi:hypothetical protein
LVMYLGEFMDVQILAARINACRSYLEALERSFQSNWLASHDLYTARKLSLFDSFALAHPAHYEGLDTRGTVRGPRPFGEEVAIGSLQCRSEQFWGYPCSQSGVQHLVADHFFPYSLGGPTVVSNKVYLCKLHNQMKSNDVHLYPWELGEPQWLSACLEAIRRLKVASK